MDDKLKEALRRVTNKMLEYSQEDFDMMLCDAGKEGRISRLLEDGMLPDLEGCLREEEDA